MDELMENELYPFKKIIESGVDSVMVGHLLLPQLDEESPSTTSHKIISGLLRKQLGFDGVIISDALNMHAVSKKYPQKGALEKAAFDAGVDVLCFSEHVEEGIDQILESATEKRIQDSFARVWDLKSKVFAQEIQSNQMDIEDCSSLNRKIAKHSITELYGNASKVEEIKSSNFLNVSICSRTNNNFSKQISSDLGTKVIELDTALNSNNQNVLLSIFPPAVKPKDQFGFDEKTLRTIHKLVEERNTLIYLFGNPYVLDILKLKPSSNVVLVYQDFPEFQEVAFEHFSDKIEAKGNLHIQLKSFGL